MSTEKQDLIPLSTRVKRDDLIKYKEYCNAFAFQHEAFTALIGKLDNIDCDLVAEQNIVLNKEKQELIEKLNLQKFELIQANLTKPLDNQCIIEFTPQLKDKLTVLRRFLKDKKEIPQEVTKEEFEAKFISKSMEYYLKYNYEFLNK